MDGYEVKKLETVIFNADIIVTATGNRDIVRDVHFKSMKDKAIVCNICLLYTSPSPRDRTRSRMPSSA